MLKARITFLGNTTIENEIHEKINTTAKQDGYHCAQGGDIFAGYFTRSMGYCDTRGQVMMVGTGSGANQGRLGSKELDEGPPFGPRDSFD